MLHDKKVLYRWGNPTKKFHFKGIQLQLDFSFTLNASEEKGECVAQKMIYNLIV